MDARAVYNPDFLAADLALEGGLLAADAGLESAIVVSLFTDRRALPDDPLPAGAGDRRGWWGDALPPMVDGEAQTADRIGSRLWLLGREKEMTSVLARAREYAEESLAWLIDDGIAAAVEVIAENPLPGTLALLVTIHRPAGDAVDFRFHHAWEAQAARGTA